MRFGIEEKLFTNLRELVKDHHLAGVKCEFEAEGSTFFDVVRLRDLCSSANTHLDLKIGGAEAKRDVLDAMVLGVDGLIAPMIETEFAVFKFRKLVESIYKEKGGRPRIAINVETKTALERLDAILEKADGFIDQVTFGRTDLSASYFDKAITPDSDFILDTIVERAAAIKKKGLRVTMGGSISVRTVQKLAERGYFARAIDQIETRK